MGQIFKMDVDVTGIGVVTFNVAGQAVNTWTEAAFRGFDRLLEELEIAKGIRGVLFISGKPDSFLAGANLKTIERLQTPEAVQKKLALFHGAFNRLSALGYPAVAAIHGQCLGGGLEFALACTARIAREGGNTLIGLPECSDGLMPGGGGTQRLPRLIGYDAFDLILAGTLLPAARAVELGIVDRLVSAQGNLAGAARDFLEEIIAGKADLKRPVHDFSGVDAIAATARASILAARGRELPGPLLALQAMQEGLKLSLAEGLESEKRYFVEAALTREAKGSSHAS
jgi:enoyl-CoA hydratase/carnithine racemase